MKGQIDFFFLLFLIFLVFAISVYVITTFFNILPNNPTKSGIQLTINGAYSFIDASILIFLFIALFLDLISSYLHPSIVKALVNFLGLFILGYMNTTFHTAYSPINTLLSTNTLLPITTSLMGGGTSLVFIFYFAMVLSIIFNIGEKK